MTISTLYAAQCTLGESPMWHSARKSCFWVDIEEGVLYELDWITKNITIRNIGNHVSLVIEGTGSQIILAVSGGVLNLNLETGTQSWLAAMDKNRSNNRCNDGACDVEGRLWIGTMDKAAAKGAGSLYRLDEDLKVVRMIGDLTIPNGLVWSLDNERMYFIDTASQCVKSYLFNKRSGEISYEKIAVQIPLIMGRPDGMTIDTKGKLWIALYGGSGIGCWDPADGKLIDLIKLPALNITNCQFIGENLDQLMVTSARQNLEEAHLADRPESGNVFLITDLGIKGIANNRYINPIQ